jgi:ribosomal protein L37AE/L43A
MKCPNCTEPLAKGGKLAESVWDCRKCGARFFILLTTRPRDLKGVKAIEVTT